VGRNLVKTGFVVKVKKKILPYGSVANAYIKPPPPTAEIKTIFMPLIPLI